jgi:hypothetical protein
MSRSNSRTTRRSSRRASSPATDSSSSSSARTVAATPARRASSSDVRRATDSRRLRYYTFQYNRDDVTHGRGSNSVRITDRASNGTVELTLQEARSLFNFLQDKFDVRG